MLMYLLIPKYDSRKSFHGKATVEDDLKRKTLYSYHTEVAYIENGRAVVTGIYSPTTLRHIKDFLKQNGFEAKDKHQILRDYSDIDD